jgi:hypothetical protein
MPSPRTVSANGIEIFLLEQGEREFERDVDATMRTVFGRGFSDPSASLFIEEARDFSAIAAPRGGCRIGSAKPTCPVSARARR